MPIFIARHGETDDNTQRIIQFPTSQLSKNGLQQANKLALRLTDMNITRILASDYQRAKQTALQVSALNGVNVEFNTELREQNFGDLRGKAYDKLHTNPFASDYQPPNGENWAVFCERIARAWQTITDSATQTQGNLLVVTHGFVCKAIFENHVTQPSHIKSLSKYGNTSLTQINGQSPWEIELLNCTAHLNE
ncbi:hypothetical protein NBRC116188_19820 [Oceaniserpentilla sp. 4NH20-0058]|uniref:histidine phosphatase family protein n=1 Tax=Oceaniserpentilla sp. 4NH20-0058 TaxID=3127660 RepID=UPI00310AD9A3